MTLRAVCRSRTTEVRSVSDTPGRSKPATCGLPESSSCCTSRKRLDRCQQAVGHRAADACGGNARAGQCRVERHRHELAGVRRPRACDDEERARATLSCRHGLVPEVGIPRENRARLLVGVLGEVAEDDDDLVLDVERGVAVVPEVLRFGNDEAVAGEDDASAHLAIVGEGERPNASRGGERVRAAACHGQPRSAVAAAAREFERHEHVGPARQGPRPDARELRGEVVGGEAFALGPCFASLEAVRGQELDVRPCCRGAGGLSVWRGRADEPQRRE